MKRLKIGLLACLLAMMAAFVLAGCEAQTYTPPDKTPNVSSAALGKAGTLRVGVNASSAPLAGKTAQSARIVGIDVDIAAYMADQMGLKVEIVDVGNDPGAALSSGLVDVVLGVDASESDVQYWRSATYIASGVALFGSASETSVPLADSKPTIAAQASSKSSWRVMNLYGDASLLSQPDLKTAFDMLGAGQVRYVASDAVIGTYVAFTNNVNAKLLALLQDPSGYCAAVGQFNTELQAAVSSALDKMVTGGTMDIIETKWLGAPMDTAHATVVKAQVAEAAPVAQSSAAAQPAAEAEGGQEGEGEGEGE